jgi:parvulin-like peptidyl-prolyl isomerase
MRLVPPLVLGGWLAAALAATPASAMAQTSPAAAPQQANRQVAAFVDGEPILVAEVERETERAIGRRSVDPAAVKLLYAETLEQLIGRRLVLKYLARNKLGASDEDIALALEQVKGELAQRNVTLPEYLAKAGLDEAAFRRGLAWQLGWRAYLARHLTDANLKKYFDQHRRDFDGTRLRAAHIFLKVEPGDDEKALESALQRAENIRAQIAAGQLTFGEAARRHSAAPTAEAGGDIGSIGRHEPMPEAFSKAAFALDAGAVSPPVLTAFGVHLIQCLEVRPGEKTWQDVRAELEPAVTAYLFRWAADRERPNAKIEYTGAAPHFRPGTRELAEGTR